MTTKQTKWNQAWQARNKERARYLRYRSTARTFVTKRATSNDLDELTALIAKRRQALQQKSSP